MPWIALMKDEDHQVQSFYYQRLIEHNRGRHKVKDVLINKWPLDCCLPDMVIKL